MYTLWLQLAKWREKRLIPRQPPTVLGVDAGSRNLGKTFLRDSVWQCSVYPHCLKAIYCIHVNHHLWNVHCPTLWFDHDVILMEKVELTGKTDIILHFHGDYGAVSNFNRSGVQGERLATPSRRARARIAYIALPMKIHQRPRRHKDYRFGWC